MATVVTAAGRAKRDRVYARRVEDGLYRVSSLHSRKEGNRYQVRWFADGWKCDCYWGQHGGGTPCKHIARILEREQREGRTHQYVDPMDAEVAAVEAAMEWLERTAPERVGELESICLCGAPLGPDGQCSEADCVCRPEPTKPETRTFRDLFGDGE
jgi:hypothetical protein